MAKRTKKEFDTGTIAFLAAIVLSAIFAYVKLDSIGYLLLAILGAFIAIQNIMAKERSGFIIATAALVIFIIGIFAVIPVEEQLKYFLSNLVIVFGVSGLIVALGDIVKLGSTK